MPRSDQLGRRCTIEPNCSVMPARLAGASVTRERALETCEASCVPEATRSFFIPVMYSPLGAVGYVAAPKLFSRRGRARSHGTHGSTGAHLVMEARSGAEGHVTAPELTSQGGEVRGHGTRGGAEAHLCMEVWSEATAYVAARGCTSCYLSLT
jgi:hypothetical protein